MRKAKGLVYSSSDSDDDLIAETCSGDRKRGYTKSPVGDGKGNASSPSSPPAKGKPPKKAASHMVGLEEAEGELRRLNARSRLKERLGVSAGNLSDCGAPASVARSSGEEELDDAVLLAIPEIKERTAMRVRRIIEIAAKSGNLKGVFVRDLKVAAKEVSEIVEDLADRCLRGDEDGRLQRDNIRLRAQVKDLGLELAALRKEFNERTAHFAQLKGNPVSGESPFTPDALRQMMEGLLDGGKRAPKGLAGGVAHGASDGLGPLGPGGNAPGVSENNGGVSSEAPPVSGNWATVAGKKGKKSKGMKSGSLPAAPVLSAKGDAGPPAEQSAAEKRPVGVRSSLAPPTTAAVVITLLQGAVERGSPTLLLCPRPGRLSVCLTWALSVLASG
ncbi:unnamed protein product [Pieris macdunnoughi]|uniref:Uncharacterized protein n=1 Tax=Pieris macdunnoughi TaxID=345717 RepID=A0A821WBP8_9NEOP|nr:unnamed protein product [Pieris macdunnoughi]